MQLFLQLAVFALKAIVITAAIVVIIGAIAKMIMQANTQPSRTVRAYRDDLKTSAAPLRDAAWTKKQQKEFKKRRKREGKKNANATHPKLWVLSFKGDIHASEGETLKDEITAVLQVADAKDEILVRVNSTGGSVVAYGLAAAHLDRIRRKGHRLTVSVDEAAASGGYLMAAVADEILAAPFSVIGSIGVIATIPHARKLLEDKGVEILEFTAGEYKRTITPFGEVTEERRQKLLEQLADIHVLFKDFVSMRRPQLSIDEIATGEYWYGSRAVERGLADRVITSDEWLLEKIDSHDIYTVNTDKPKTGLLHRIFQARGRLAHALLGVSDTDDTHDAHLPKI